MLYKWFSVSFLTNIVVKYYRGLTFTGLSSNLLIEYYISMLPYDGTLVCSCWCVLLYLLRVFVSVRFLRSVFSKVNLS